MTKNQLLKKFFFYDDDADEYYVVAPYQVRYRNETVNCVDVTRGEMYVNNDHESCRWWKEAKPKDFEVFELKRIA